MKAEPASRILTEDPALAERVSLKPLVSNEPVKKKEQQKR